MIGQGVWILWGVENCHLPLTKPVAVNTGLALPRSPWWPRIFSLLLLIFVMYVKPLAVIFCGFWDSLFSGDAYLRLTRDFGSNRIVVLSRTTNRFLFPSLIWLLTVTTYFSVLDKSVLFLWAKNLDVQQMRTSIPASGLMYNFISLVTKRRIFQRF